MDEVAFMRELVPEFACLDNTDYIQNRFKMYKEYIEQSEIPALYRFEVLENPFGNWAGMEKEIGVKEFVEDITSYLEGEFRCIFNFPTYTNTDKFSAYIIQRYLRHYFASDKPIKKVLYIDTPLLAGDLKRIIGLNGDTDFSRLLVHRPDTVRKGIEDADFIIWDKITNLNTGYEVGELYRILSVRHKRGLGNLFFITGGKEEALKRLSSNVVDMLTGCSLVNIYK